MSARLSTTTPSDVWRDQGGRNDDDLFVIMKNRVIDHVRHLPERPDAGDLEETCRTALHGAFRTLIFNQDRPGPSVSHHEIGSAYERLLALHPVIDEQTGQFMLLENRIGATSKRKRTGAFFTPESVIEGLLDWSLEPAMDDALASDPSHPERALLSMRICDPSCGIGHFLIAAARRMSRRLTSLRAGASNASTPSDPSALREIIGNCIFGVDINPVSVDICRWLLQVESGDASNPPDLQHHIVVGHALLGTAPGLIGRGIPDEAYAAHHERCRAELKQLRARNRLERCRWPLPDAIPPRYARLVADAWCASFFTQTLLEQRLPVEDCISTATLARIAALGAEAMSPATRRAMNEIRDHQRFFHWFSAFPEVVSQPDADGICGEVENGFDVIIGNPPFLSQLQSATVSSRAAATLLSCRTNHAVARYVDLSAAFLFESAELLKPGGRIALIQPQSILASADAARVRQHLTGRCDITHFWLAREQVFPGATVLTCAPVLRKKRAGETVSANRMIVRATGARMRQEAPVTVRASELSVAQSWSCLAADLMGIPIVNVSGAARTIGDVAAATADFRDEYYGLDGFIIEDTDIPHAARESPDFERRFPRLITTGLIDLARCHWGSRTTRIMRRRWLAPRVDRARMERDGRLGRWIDARLVPKILLATQTRILEIFVDDAGLLLPSTPTITIIPNDPMQIWRIAASLASPISCAMAFQQCAGAGMSARSIRITARQVMTMPRADDIESEWAEGSGLNDAARALQRAQAEMIPGHDEEHQRQLNIMAKASLRAFGTVSSQLHDELLNWWHRQQFPPRFSSSVSAVSPCSYPS